MSLKVTYVRAIGAEFLATLLFVYVGCGSVLSTVLSTDPTDILSIALSFGLSITVLVYTFGHYSGGHINPIVTIAMLIWGKIELAKATLYIIAQLLGAIVGAALLMGTTETATNNPLRLTVNQVSLITNEGGAFLMELVLSFLLVFVIAQTALNKRSGAGPNAPIAIGLAVFMAHIVSIPFTGTSINPARSFGPAVVSGEFDDLWLFFVAPILGGVIAAFSAEYLFDFKNAQDLTGEPILNQASATNA